jgi:hypothetical protein
MEAARLFLTAILNSVQDLPRSFRTSLVIDSTVWLTPFSDVLCAHLQDEVKDKFPQSKHSIVGGFLFLRFICPVLVSPEGLNIENLSKESRRTLVLISKILQNLANGIDFGRKEPCKFSCCFLCICQFITRLLQIWSRSISSSVSTSSQSITSSI